MNSDVSEKKCPQCGEKIVGDEQMCPKCGASLREKTIICATCGTEAPMGAKFCSECGRALTGDESGNKRDGRVAEKKKLESWIPTIPIIILISLCLVVVFLGIRNTPAALLASGLETIAAIGKPTQTPTASPAATTTQTATTIPTQTATATSTPIPPPTPPADAKLKDTWISPMDGMVLVYIPKGQYLIGSLDSDPQASINEKPQHKVDLSGYWMDKTEVTNAMYAKCVQAGACPVKIMDISFTRDSYYGNAEYDNYPVIYVTWDEAQTYCTWAGRSLPTEAEWEVAARGPDRRKYPWGNSAANCNLLNFGGGLANYCTGDTTAVGKYPQGASPYGILDMAGNVWEWVADWYGSNYLVEPHQDPLGFPTGENRVIRGGSWFNNTEYIRTTFRTNHSPDDATEYIGFRCAR